MTAIQTHTGLNRVVALFASIATVVALSGVAVLAGALQANAAGHANLNDGDLIRVSGTDDVYIVKMVGSEMYKRLILSPTVFDSYGHLSWDDINDVSQAVSDEFEESNLVMEVYADGTPVNGQVFELRPVPNSDEGTKHHLDLTPAQFEAEGYSWNQIYNINHTDAGVYTTGAAVTGDGEEEEEEDVTVGVEGDMVISRNPEPGHSEAEYGDTGHAALGFSVEAEDSSLNVQRIDVYFEHTSGGTAENEWDLLDSASLYADGDLVDTVVASKANFNPGTSAGAERLRFQGWSEMVPADGSVDFEVRLNFSDDDDLDDGGTLEVRLAADAVRATDSAGIQIMEGAASITRNVLLEQPTDEVPDVTSSLADDSPEGVVIIDEDDPTTVETSVFELEIEDAPLTLDRLEVNVNHSSGSGDLDAELAFVRLVYDGTSIGNEGLSGVADGGAVEFDDLGLELEEGTHEFTVEVRVREMGAGASAEGDVLSVDLVEIDYTYEDKDGDEVVVVDEAHAVTGSDLNLFTVAPNVTFQSGSLTKVDDDAEGTLTFTVTAEGGDLYIGKAQDGGANSVAVMDATWPTGGAGTDPSAAYLVEVSGHDGEETNNYLVQEGTTVTVTVTVYVTAGDGATAFGRVLVDDIAWRDTDVDDTTYNTDALGDMLDDFETNAVSIPSNA